MAAAQMAALAATAGAGPLLQLQSASGAGVGGEARTAPGYERLAFTLAVDAVSPGATVKVWVQQTFDGTAWDDLVRFPDVTAAGRWTGRLAPDGGSAAGIHQWLDGGLAPNTVRDVLTGTRFRAKYEVAGGNATLTLTGYAVFPRVAEE